MERITGLYPQYQIKKDRRQQNIPVAVERRSGRDRRSEDRVALDTTLTKDIYTVKKQVAKIEALAPKLFEQNVTKQAPTFTSMNNMTQDQLVKESKPDFSALQRQEAALKNKASLSFQLGILSAALAGAIALSFLGSTGAVIALGTSFYVGARIVKALIVKNLKNDENIKNK